MKRVPTAGLKGTVIQQFQTSIAAAFLSAQERVGQYVCLN